MAKKADQMSESMANCEKCGVKIMPTTAKRHGGLCAPCGTGRKIDPAPRNHEVHPGRHLDWMLINIELDQDKKDYADFFFETSVLDKDPRFKSRRMKVGVNRGLIRMHKASGEIELLQPMPEDTQKQIFNRAAAKLKQHWKDGEIPTKTMYACG